jgi:hypothetical protein
MLNLTPNRPAEFMTTVAGALTEHTRLRPASLIRTKALAASLADAAFLAIVGIDPSGTIDPEALERVRGAFAAAAPFEPFAGGAPVEPVGLYFSDHSKMTIEPAPRPIERAPASSIPDYPHFEAVAGVSRILQQAHIPFGVVTRANLGDLARWPVLVLANVQLMAPEEIAAIREYVRGGGRVYASRATSLRGVEEQAWHDFAMADVFGCHLERAESGRLVYARAASWPEPQRPLAHWHSADGKTGAMRIRAGGGETLVALTLPYGHPHPGAVGDAHWASIHSSPPWQHLDTPMVVRNRFGAGTAIYSAFDIEAGQSPEHDALFLSLIRALAPAPMVEAETHPHVWLSAFDQGDRLVVYLLNYQLDDPPLPIPAARVRIRVPAGRRCTGVRRAPGLDLVRTFTLEPGVIEFEAGPIDLVSVHVVDLD